MLLIFQPITPFMCLLLIYVILQCEISSLMNWIFFLVQTGKNIQFVKLKISN